MSMNNLTVEGEFRYIVQWFNEWSELQRDDFIPILIDYLTKETPGVYVNGVVSGLSNADILDKPMSLFQCRIKLFKEWTPKWPEDMKLKLREKIVEMDPKVGEKIINELKSIKGNCAGEISNGNGHNIAHLNPTVTEELIAAAIAVVEDTELALNAVGVLNHVASIAAANNQNAAELDEQAGGDHVAHVESVSVNEEVPLVA